MSIRRTGVVGVSTLTVLLLTVASILPAAGVGAQSGSSGQSGGTVDLSDAVEAEFTVTPGVEQVTITDAPKRAPLTLIDESAERIVTLFTDDRGQLVVQFVPNSYRVHDSQTEGVLPTVDGKTLPPGTYRVVSEGTPDEPAEGPVAASDEFDVLAVDDVPDESYYDQVIDAVPTNILGGAVLEGFTDEDGYGYLTTRDGTSLSVSARLPDPSIYGDGPYPTVVQYSGYAPSRPGVPAGADAAGILATTFGFAFVGVNLRGTGCSGGVYDTFSPPQGADGYDVIETVARQPWVKNGRPGMMGISYSGIMQLFVASTQPPSLAAITPLSVIEDPWYQQWPGGIYNAGFAREWLESQDSEALGGNQWVKDRVAGGDETCAANLRIRSQNMSFEEFARSLERRPVDADARNLSRLVPNIDVPVFLASSWHDEQTGSRFGLMLDDFTSVPKGQTKFTMYNGHHQDPHSPLLISRWYEFLSFYVDRSVPQINPLIRAAGPVVLEDNFGVPNAGFEPDRFVDKANYEEALAAYESEEPVRVLFEVGASPAFPDHPKAHRQRYERSFSAWPPPQADARTWYFGPGGSLVDTASSISEAERFSFDPDALASRYHVGGGWEGIEVETNWTTTEDGRGLAYETEPLPNDLVIAGEGYVDLWLRSTGTDAPLEVVLTEVYPSDGDTVEERRVQHGLLRAGYRTVDESRSSGTRIDHRYGAADYRPLPRNQFVNVQVPLYSVAHPFRAGSRIRIEVNTPGGDAALWAFESEDFGATTHDIGRGGVLASALVLPVLPATATAGQIPDEFASQADRPSCESLRGQPCRQYRRLANESIGAIESPIIESVDSRGDAQVAPLLIGMGIAGAVLAAASVGSANRRRRIDHS